MIAKIQIEGKSFTIDFGKPLDISIPLKNGEDNPKAWFAPNPEFLPVVSGDFIGSVKEGGAVNFYNVFFNPHGNGTHTECAGHILKEQLNINECLQQYWFYSQLISIKPNQIGQDLVITKEQLDGMINYGADSLIIRTLPNSKEKLNVDYSGKNPPYIHHNAVEYLVEKKIKHLLVDLPSVDREEDEGLLKSHNSFWQTSGELRKDCTITEFIFVPEEIEDGNYILNIQIAPLELDASPSKPVLYKPSTNR